MLGADHPHVRICGRLRGLPPLLGTPEAERCDPNRRPRDGLVVDPLLRGEPLARCLDVRTGDLRGCHPLGHVARLGVDRRIGQALPTMVAAAGAADAVREEGKRRLASRNHCLLRPRRGSDKVDARDVAQLLKRVAMRRRLAQLLRGNDHRVRSVEPLGAPAVIHLPLAQFEDILHVAQPVLLAGPVLHPAACLGQRLGHVRDDFLARALRCRHAREEGQDVGLVGVDLVGELAGQRTVGAAVVVPQRVHELGTLGVAPRSLVEPQRVLDHGPCALAVHVVGVLAVQRALGRHVPGELPVGGLAG